MRDEPDPTPAEAAPRVHSGVEELVQELAKGTGIRLHEGEVAQVAAVYQEYLGYIATLTVADVALEDEVPLRLDVAHGPTSHG